MKSFFNSKWFEPHWKTRLHIGQIVLVVLIIGLTGARINTKPDGMPTSRSDTIAITMVRTVGALDGLGRRLANWR